MYENNLIIGFHKNTFLEIIKTSLTQPIIPALTLSFPRKQESIHCLSPKYYLIPAFFNLVPKLSLGTRTGILYLYNF